MSTPLWRIFGPPICVDLSHNNAEPIDFDAMYADGIRLVIHKATQGADFVDPTYASRRKRALDAGMLWEAYHFADASPPRAQSNNFMAVAQPDAGMRLALDVEPNHGSTISPGDADALADGLDQRRGVQTWRYSGMGWMTPAAISATARLRAGPWWWAKYGPQPTAARLAMVGIDWQRVCLWQETESGTRRGVAGSVDESYWLGTMDDLSRYPALPAGRNPGPMLFPVVLTRGDVRLVQAALIAAGYDCGPSGADGLMGPATGAAISAYCLAHGIAPAGIDAALWRALFGG